MGLIETASNKSLWRGIDYEERGMVKNWTKTGKCSYDGRVKGSDKNVYDVHIETDHPRKSTCTCPFAAGRRAVCKHMIALYFTAEPEAKAAFMKEVEEWEAEEEERHQELLDDIWKYVCSLNKNELREELYKSLVELEERENYWW